FQAEDGVRDDLVTGVQTCALPILDVADRLVCIAHDLVHDQLLPEASPSNSELGILSQSTLRFLQVMCALKLFRKLARVEILTNRSEERRVGRECRYEWSRDSCRSI